MSTTRVSEAVARAGRTLPQGGLGWAVTEGIDAFLVDMNDRQYGIAVILLTAAFAFVQASIENGIGKAFLRNVPPTKAPVVDTYENDELEVVDEVEEAPALDGGYENPDLMVGERVAPEHDLDPNTFEEVEDK